MAQVEILADRHSTMGWLFRSLETLIGALAVWRQTVANRHAIAGLTTHELRDIGHPLADSPSPTLEIKAGLMANLMSMR